MIMLRKRNNYSYLAIVLFCMQSCYAQSNKVIKTFFEREKSKNYQSCIKEGKFDEMKKTVENKEVIKQITNGCKHESEIFDNFIDGTNTLLAAITNNEDFNIYNWKKYDPYIPAPTVTLLQKNQSNVVEFTYYDKEKKNYGTVLIRNVFEDKKDKFKDEILYIQTKLNGEKVDGKIVRHERNDYYIIKRIKGKLSFYTLIDGNLIHVE